MCLGPTTNPRNGVQFRSTHVSRIFFPHREVLKGSVLALSHISARVVAFTRPAMTRIQVCRYTKQEALSWSPLVPSSWKFTSFPMRQV